MREYSCEYRCVNCLTRVGAKKPVEIYCIKCKTVLQRWK